MRIAFAQIDSIVGAFEANIEKIKKAYERACQEQARLLLTPELSLCGYPPLDLIDRPEIFERNERGLQVLQDLTRGQTCALVIGHVAHNPSEIGKAAQNCISVLENGKRVFTQAKTLLPTYDVFDEARYFEPSSSIDTWSCDGIQVGFAICEDLWANDPRLKSQMYGRDPVSEYKKRGVDLLFSISASPYEFGKSERRERLHQSIAQRLQVPLIYVNQVGATDEILFDGGSFVVGAQGGLEGRLPFFQTSFAVVEVHFEDKSVQWELPVPAEREDQTPNEMEMLSRALVCGIREYFFRTGFKTAILGLSGGIDSSVVAALAVRALGSQNVFGIAMPSQVSSSHSLEDAQQLAKNLKIPFEVRPIKFLYSTASRELSENRGELASIALENLQSRLRGVILMTLSNHYSALVLTTGNKSELAMGYCTLYGDMAGALAPIGDLLKTQVYQLARYMNHAWGGVIPERCITKAPSAELKPNQTHQDTLPPYELLDAFLKAYLDDHRSIAEIEQSMSDKDRKLLGPTSELLRRFEVNEYKRRQAAPVLKVSSKSFGIGRRVPLAKRWEISP